LEFLRDQKRHERSLILATAADEKVARAINQEVGLFQKIFASDGGTRGRLRRIAPLSSLISTAFFCAQLP
jgi:hypothetical protein